QQRVKQPGHPVPVCDFDKVLSNWEIALFLYPAGTCVTTIRRRKLGVSNVEKRLFVAHAVDQWIKGFGTPLRLTQSETFLFTRNRARHSRFCRAKPISHRLPCPALSVTCARSML
ncbi:hypothetical protein, partial [Symmachiella macrocystis]|uniref:hypothetical protein n=1 Tax=Symmachiella macrocystis TaxID=2527985 RepID=UPI001E5C6579